MITFMCLASSQCLVRVERPDRKDRVGKKGRAHGTVKQIDSKKCYTTGQMGKPRPQVMRSSVPGGGRRQHERVHSSPFPWFLASEESPQPWPTSLHSTRLCETQLGGKLSTLQKSYERNYGWKKSLPYKLAKLFRTCRKQGI